MGFTLSPGVYGPSGISYRYKKRFMWIPSRMHNGKMVWLKPVVEKIEVWVSMKYNSPGDGYPYIHESSVGLYTKEEVFLEEI